MASQPTDPGRLPQSAPVTLGCNGALERRRADRAEHKQTRPISARKCRLARWLRRTANRERPRPLTRTREPLLHYRAAAVRSDLLEIAALLSTRTTPTPPASPPCTTCSPTAATAPSTTPTSTSPNYTRPSTTCAPASEARRTPSATKRADEHTETGPRLQTALVHYARAI